jgi:hypothetical protein
MSLPIACSLTDSELQQRRRDVVQRVRTAVAEIRELEDGFAYRFSLDSDRLLELARLIELERRCCPFLRFRVMVEPGDSSACLEMSGPEGTKEFLDATFALEVEDST